MKKQHKIIYSFIFGFLGAFLLFVLFVLYIFSNEDKLLSYIFEKNIQNTQNILSVESGKSNSEIKLITQEDLLISAIEKANPAVVSIVVTKDVPIIEKYYEETPGFFNSPFFGDIFGRDFFNFKTPKYREKGTEKKEVGSGSGFIVSEDGLLVTNKHVLDDGEAEYTVFTNDGKKHNAKVVARDPVNDIAILKIEGDGFSYLKFANSSDVKLGQTTIAIGNSLGEFRNTVSTGIVSGLSRSIVAGDGLGFSEQLEGVIQTDAAINPGNSGGPLLNLKGEVIGVNVAVARNSENIGFALPADMVKLAVESVKKDGKITRAYLGVRYILINDLIKEKNNLSVDYGALIIRGENPEDLAVVPGSPADKAGIVENNIILEVDGIKVDKENSLASLLKSKKAGEKVSLKILSKGEEKVISVVLGEFPSE